VSWGFAWYSSKVKKEAWRISPRCLRRLGFKILNLIRGRQGVGGGRGCLICDLLPDIPKWQNIL
jgi:hypothetical protein